MIEWGQRCDLSYEGEEDDETFEYLKDLLGIPGALCFRLVHQNDEVFGGTPEERWKRTLTWVQARIVR
jgi:hypothetical protein